MTGREAAWIRPRRRSPPLSWGDTIRITAAVRGAEVEATGGAGAVRGPLLFFPLNNTRRCLGF